MIDIFKIIASYIGIGIVLSLVFMAVKEILKNAILKIKEFLF